MDFLNGILDVIDAALFNQDNMMQQLPQFLTGLSLAKFNWLTLKEHTSLFVDAALELGLDLFHSLVDVFEVRILVKLKFLHLLIVVISVNY